MNVIQAFQMLNQIKNNPMSFLSQRFNVDGVNVNNPSDVLKHLVDSGQINQSQIDQIKSQIGIK
jgi:hypothetical protein